jgi:AhpC/TSA family
MRENGLDFPILSDSGNETAAAFGLRVALPGYRVDLYTSLKNNLPVFNGDTSWTLPMPGRYAIGQDGIIRYAEVNPDYTHRPEPSNMLSVLRTQATRGRCCSLQSRGLTRRHVGPHRATRCTFNPGGVENGQIEQIFFERHSRKRI